MLPNQWSNSLSILDDRKTRPCNIKEWKFKHFSATQFANLVDTGCWESNWHCALESNKKIKRASPTWDGCFYFFSKVCQLKWQLVERKKEKWFWSVIKWPLLQLWMHLNNCSSNVAENCGFFINVKKLHFYLLESYYKVVN